MRRPQGRLASRYEIFERSDLVLGEFCGCLAPMLVTQYCAVTIAR